MQVSRLSIGPLDLDEEGFDAGEKRADDETIAADAAASPRWREYA
jgi:hypothetical protein